MSRNPLIEAIHSARYDFETASRSEKSAARAELSKRLGDALARSNSKLSEQQLLEILFDDYKEYRRMKKRQAWPKL